MKSNAGFSLWEAFIVLLVLSVLLWLTPQPQLTQWQSSYRLDLFCQRMAHLFLQTQTQAISHGSVYQIIFLPQENVIRIKESRFQNTAIDYPLPQDWRLTHYYHFYYLANARTTQFKTVHVHNQHTNQHIAIKFQLGSGRFEME